MSGRPLLLDQIAEKADALLALMDAVHEAREQLHDLMVEAHRQGIPAARIGRAAHLSRERARRIIEERTGP